MAIQLSVAVRDARLNAIETTGGTSCSLEIRSGTQPANCAAAGSGSVLATMNLPTDWLAAASSGSKAIAGTWQDATADAAGTAGHFRIYSSQATKDGTTCIIQGSITATSGGGDMEIDNTSIALNQQVTVTTFTLTDGNA
jgi:hypothetical protein